MYDHFIEKLLDRYIKILKINITNDTYSVIKYDNENEKLYVDKTDKISEWLKSFSEEGNVYTEDVKTFKEYTSLSYLKQFFMSNDNHWVQYRRLSGDKYIWYEMEMFKAEDYSDDNQKLYLLVRKMNEFSKAEIRMNFYKSGKKVLLIQKNEAERRELALSLMDEYEVIETEEDSDALEILNENCDDIVAVFIDLSDAVPGEKNLLNSIRSVSRYDTIPAIVANDAGSQEFELECLKNGASELVVKPCNPVIIKNRIKSLTNLMYLKGLLYSMKRDTLTNLYTKPFFFKKVRETLQNNPDKSYRVICTDVESFRLINENYGEDVGDSVLAYIADKISDVLPNILFGGRITSDVFAFLREDIPFEYNKEGWRCFRENAPVPNLVIKYGIATVDRRLTVQKMCDHAHVAVQSIKKKYDVPYAEYTDEMQQKILRQQRILDNMETALKERQFKVYYQPKYSFEEKRICGAEALVRWIHPKLGFLSPAEFIPLFENNGFITKLDEYVREQVCVDLSRWAEVGLPIIPISVNISRKDFENKNLVESICELVKRWNVSPSMLHIEVTESAFSDNIERISEMIKKLRREGFIVELDDFGSGYSALTTLNKIELDVMKIDRSILVQNSDNSENKVLQFCMELAKFMDLETVMEGVETKEQWDVLSAMGCDTVQGYYYSKPLPVDEFEEFSANHY